MASILKFVGRVGLGLLDIGLGRVGSKNWDPCRSLCDTLLQYNSVCVDACDVAINASDDGDNVDGNGDYSARLLLRQKSKLTR